jgi:hypothetical protein
VNRPCPAVLTIPILFADSGLAAFTSFNPCQAIEASRFEVISTLIEGILVSTTLAILR